MIRFLRFPLILFLVFEMYEKKTEIINLNVGDSVDDIFVVKFKKPLDKYSGGWRFELRLGDKTGEINAKFWGPEEKDVVEDIYNSFSKDDVVLVKGKVSKYKNSKEITIYEIKLVKKGEYKEDSFLGMSKRSIDDMYGELLEKINSIGDDDIRRLLENIFVNDDEIREAFKKSPAAIFKHHNYIGGLLEHTLEVVKILETYIEIHKELDRDITIAGGLLHDIGKIKSFHLSNNISITKYERMEGHITMGVSIVTKKMDEMNFPEEKRLKLIHIILSHHGQNEFGSPKTPMFPEALAVYFADLADSQLKNMISFKQNARTEDDFIYSRDFGNIYLI